MGPSTINLLLIMSTCCRTRHNSFGRQAFLLLFGSCERPKLKCWQDRLTGHSEYRGAPYSQYNMYVSGPVPVRNFELCTGNTNQANWKMFKWLPPNLASSSKFYFLRKFKVFKSNYTSIFNLKFWESFFHILQFSELFPNHMQNWARSTLPK